MSDARLRTLERASAANPADDDARQGYAQALARAHGLEGLARLGMYPALGELDRAGDARAFGVALHAFARLVAERRAAYLCGGDELISLVRQRPGPRYVRISCPGGRVLCLVDTKGGNVRGQPTSRGDVLRAAPSKGPSKHARGSIFDAHGGGLAVDERGVAVELGVLYRCVACDGWHTGTARRPRACDDPGGSGSGFGGRQRLRRRGAP